MPYYVRLKKCYLLCKAVLAKCLYNNQILLYRHVLTHLSVEKVGYAN